MSKLGRYKRQGRGTFTIQKAGCKPIPPRKRIPLRLRIQMRQIRRQNHLLNEPITRQLRESTRILYRISGDNTRIEAVDHLFDLMSTVMNFYRFSIIIYIIAYPLYKLIEYILN